MKHNDSLDDAKKLLIAAQKFLLSQDLAPIPMNYAVAYEIASLRNPALNDAIVQLRDNNQRLDNYIMQDLHQTHVLGTPSAVEQFANPMSKIIFDIVQNIASTGENTAQYGEILSENTSKIQSAKSGEELQRLASALASATSEAQQEQSKLKKQLEHAQHEATVLKESINKINEEAFSDELTGLLNRKGMKAKLKTLAESDDMHVVSAIMLDIDHFKKINDTYGHLLGDRVISGAGTEIGNNVRGRDIAARYGGEEFVVILPRTDSEGARIVAENIRKAICELRWKNKKTGLTLPPVTVSAGVAECSGDEEIDTLIARADEALYEAKRSGRDRVYLAKL